MLLKIYVQTSFTILKKFIYLSATAKVVVFLYVNVPYIYKVYKLKRQYFICRISLVYPVVRIYNPLATISSHKPTFAISQTD